MNNIFKIVLYLRISNEDIDLDGFKYESSSICNQRELLKQFVKDKKIYYSDLLEVIDDGYSGTNFKRPGIQSIFRMIKNKEINCIIVKDLSRLGRNYIEVGNYIENIFPSYGIRFISVNDNYDSFEHNTVSLDLKIKNIIYDIYSKELSIKIKKSRRLLAQQGKFTAPFAPFGYKKSIADKYKLEIDKKAAKIVKKIFQMALNDSNVSDIVKYLNENNIVTPSLYKKNNYKYINKSDKDKLILWTDSTVRKILKNEVYLGNIVCYSDKSSQINNNKVIVRNVHQPIINIRDFELLQNKLKSSSCNYYKYKKINSEEIFSAKLKCGICGNILYLNKGVYLCKKNDKKCFKISINENDLKQIIHIYLIKLIHIYIDSFNKDNKVVNTLVNKKNNILLNKTNLFQKLCNNVISENEYKQNIDKLNIEISTLSKQVNVYNKENDIINYHFSSINKNLVKQFISKIYVYENKIEIIWKFNIKY